MDQKRFLILASFFVIYIVWGSTYLANIIAIESIPPFLLVASRLLTAGILLTIITKLLRKWEKPTKKQWKNLLISSLLFLGIGLTGVVWAEQFIDSGVTSLIISLEPLTLVLMMWLVNKSLPASRKFIGCFLGIIGMYLLVSQQDIVAGANDWKGLAAILTSVISWAIGSIFISKADLPKSMLTIASIQMLISGFIISIISIIHGDLIGIDVFTWKYDVYISWIFLVFLGSILAYTAFNFLLKNVSPDKVATATYVHPIVAVFLGWSIRGEIISVQTILAMFVMLLGVFFINMEKNFLRRIGLKSVQVKKIR